MKFEITFSGGMADQNLIPSIEGSNSLEGISRCAILIGNYITEGKIRYKAPFTEDFNFYFEAIESGSFRTRCVAVISDKKVKTFLAGAIGMAVVQGPVGNFTYDIMKYAFSSVAGISVEPETLELKRLLDAKNSEIAALKGAMTPAAKRGHFSIGHGVNQIDITGNNNTITIYNQKSKDFLDGNETSDSPNVRLFSCGRFNANAGVGGLYDFEVKRIIPFTIGKNATPQTSGILGRSLAIYSEKTRVDRYEKSQVYVSYLETRNPNGDLVHLIVLDAWQAEAD